MIGLVGNSRLSLGISVSLVAALAACAPAPQADSAPGTANELPRLESPLAVEGEPSPEPSPSPTREPRTVTINYSGDLLWHNTLWTSAEIDARNQGKSGMDFYPQLSALTDYVSSADVAICHNEVPYAPPGGPYENYPTFAAPQEVADALPKVGWDVCTTASNHSLDQGFDGLTRTLDVLSNVGIKSTGTYATAEAETKPTIFTTENGVKVAVVSSTYGTNGIPRPEGKAWSVTSMDHQIVLSQAKRARDAGADIVVVHMHAGTEYDFDPNQQQIEFAKAMTASDDVDLVVGQHAHVVQPINRMNDKWVAYGAGNLIAQSSPSQPYTYDGYLATFTFTEDPETGKFHSTEGEFAPSFITKHSSSSPARVYIISEAVAAGEGPTQQLQESAARTRKVVASSEVEGLTEH